MCCVYRIPHFPLKNFALEWLLMQLTTTFKGGVWLWRMAPPDLRAGGDKFDYRSLRVHLKDPKHCVHTHVPQLTEATNPAVGCHYFAPGPQLPPQPHIIAALWRWPV